MKIETPELKFNTPNENIKGDELKATRSKKRELGDAKKTQVKGRTTKQTKQRVKLTEEQKKARQREYNRRYYERHKEEIKAKARARYAAKKADKPATDRAAINKVGRELKAMRKEQIAIKAERLAAAQIEQEQLTGKRNDQLYKLIDDANLESLFSGLYYRETLIATGRKPDVSAQDVVEQWLKANKVTTKDKELELLAKLTTIDSFKDEANFNETMKKYAESAAKHGYMKTYNQLLSFGRADYAVYRTLQDILYDTIVGEHYSSEALNDILVDLSKSNRPVEDVVKQFMENLSEVKRTENTLAGKKLQPHEIEAILRRGF